MSTQEVASSEAMPLEEHSTALKRLSRRLALRNGIAMAVLWLITIVVAAIFIYVIIYLLVQGASTLVSASFYGTSEIGIAPELFNTFYILILTEIFLFPISLAAAIFLVFAVYAHMGTSRLAGALTLLCLNFPLALRLFEQSLAAVPGELREGGLALGSTRWHMIRTVVLPSALPGLVTGLILTAGKVIGEAAALIFTMGIFNPGNVFTLNPLIASDTLTTRLYYVKGPGAGSLPGVTSSQETALAAGIAAVLIVLLLVINIASRAVGRAIERRITAA
jgi:phosphate transport system permease protein